VAVLLWIFGIYPVFLSAVFLVSLDFVQNQSRYVTPTLIFLNRYIRLGKWAACFMMLAFDRNPNRSDSIRLKGLLKLTLSGLKQNRVRVVEARGQ